MNRFLSLILTRAPADEGGGAPPPGGEQPGGTPPPAQQPPAGGGQQTPPPGGEPDPLAWLEGVTLDEQSRKGLIDTKTVTPAALYNRMRNAEKMLRGDVVEAPPSDPEKLGDWMRSPKVAAALGVPETPDGYDRSAPETDDPMLAAMIGWSADREGKVAEMAHKLGVPKTLYDPLRKAFMDHMASELAADIAGAKADVAKMTAELRAEWGDGYADAERLAVETLQRFGVDETAAELLRRTGVIGSTQLLRMAHALGMATAEDGQLLGGSPPPPAMTQEQAKAALAAFDREHGQTLQTASRNDLARLELVAKRRDLMRAAGMMVER